MTTNGVLLGSILLPAFSFIALPLHASDTYPSGANVRAKLIRALQDRLASMAAPTKPEETGDTEFHCLARARKTTPELKQAVLNLINAKVDPRTPNLVGRTPLEEARRQNNRIYMTILNKVTAALRRIEKEPHGT